VWLILAALVGTLVVVAAEQPLPKPEIARIMGRLTMEGRPLARHSVVFMEPSRGDLAFGTTDAEGRFIIDSWKGGDMTPGRYRAYVRPPRVDDDNAHGEGPLMPNEYADRYLDVSTTPLEYRIAIGDNRYDIDLERKQTPAAESSKPKKASPNDGREAVTP
jgi:hypothetical protein